MERPFRFRPPINNVLPTLLIGGGGWCEKIQKYFWLKITLCVHGSKYQRFLEKIWKRSNSLTFSRRFGYCKALPVRAGYRRDVTGGTLASTVLCLIGNEAGQHRIYRLSGVFRGLKLSQISRFPGNSRNFYPRKFSLSAAALSSMGVSLFSTTATE